MNARLGSHDPSNPTPAPADVKAMVHHDPGIRLTGGIVGFAEIMR